MRALAKHGTGRGHQPGSISRVYASLIALPANYISARSEPPQGTSIYILQSLFANSAGLRCSCLGSSGPAANLDGPGR